MIDCGQVTISGDLTIRETIRRIDECSLQIALVVDEQRRLIGTVTDGDVRRGILRGVLLDQPVSLIMNKKPTTLSQPSDRETVLVMMRGLQIRQIPIVNENGQLLGLEVMEKVIAPEARSNVAVVMAGGAGTRLRDLTRDCPKPMLEVGGRAILETILLNLLGFGFRHFYFAVNYKAGMIESHFGSGSKWNVKIEYLRETQRMGTAGALSLLPTPTQPFLVMNGDLLTNVNVDSLLDFHESHGATATMCVREYDMQVPYGVLGLDHHRIVKVREKPIERYFVNAGVYVLDPRVLRHIPYDEFFDMTALFEKLIHHNEHPAAFPIREYWRDIGRPADLERAHGEFEDVFE